ncbi:MAG TPA: hypothetical protein VF712_19990 [Thermoleophilaceae bacterium]|jgi:hypothetical protein
MNPFGRVTALPADVIAGLRALPGLARDIAQIAAATDRLPQVERATTDMERHTRVLPEVIESLGKLGEATQVLVPMDGRMQNIEGAMPVLVEVQQHLAQLPQTMERLDRGVVEMAGVLERLLISMDELNTTLGNLEGSVGPLGRLAGRLPGGGKRESEAKQAAPPAPEAAARASDGPPQS